MYCMYVCTAHCRYDTPDHAHERRVNFLSSDFMLDPEGDRLGHRDANNRRLLTERRFIFPEIGNEDRADCPDNARGQYGEGSFTLHDETM